MTTYTKPQPSEQVYLLLEQAGADGLTDKEIARALGGTSRDNVLKYARRRLDLVHAGRVKRSKLRRPDPVTDRLQKVWVVA